MSATTACGRHGKFGPGSPTFFTLGQRFTKLRNAPGNEWLKDYSYTIVRYACKYMGDAYAAFFDPDPDHGRPQYKAKPGLHHPVPRAHPGWSWTRLGPIHRYADASR